MNKEKEQKFNEIVREESVRNKEIFGMPLNDKQLEYIDYLFEHSNVEPINVSGGFTCELWEAFIEAMERKDLSDNEIISQFLTRGNKDAGNKDKLKPLIVPPTDLIEFINFIVSYLYYTHEINTWPYFKRYEFNYTNYYLHNVPFLKMKEELEEELEKGLE